MLRPAKILTASVARPTRLRTAALLFALCTLSAPVQAERYVPLQNPPELQLIGSRKLTEAEIRPLLLDALDRAATPTLQWTVDSEQPGLMVAKFLIRSHSARVNIHYSPAAIRIAYKDSDNLGYEIKDGQPYIHRNYHIWVDFLVSKIKYVVARFDTPDKVALREGAAPAAVPGASAQPATPPVAVAKAGSAYKVGIFPAAGNFGYLDRGGHEGRTMQIIVGIVNTYPQLSLSYSSYEPTLAFPRLSKPESLWTGGATRQHPNMAAVTGAARQRGLSGVLLVWGDSPGTWGVGSTPEGPPIEIYLVDVERGRLYSRKGYFSGAEGMIHQVLKDFLRARN